MRHTVFLSLTLAAIWLANSGQYTPLMLSFGLISIIFVVWIAHKMDVMDREAQTLRLTMRLPLYWCWIMKEVVLSNIDVVKRVWLGPSSIDPQVATFTLSQTTDVGRVVYANSITLTPGTVTLDLQKNSLTVHALSPAGIDDLLGGEMDRRVRRLEP